MTHRSFGHGWTGSHLAASVLAVALLAGGCAGGAGTSTVPSPDLPASPTMTVPSASPIASLSPSGVRAGPYPGVPPLDPGIDGTFEIDAFATAAVDIVPASEIAGGPPWRFDTGDPDPSTHPVIGFARGLPLVVLYGPIVVDGVEWYLLTSAILAVDVPIGWSPIASPDGAEWIVPTSVSCPPSPVPAEQLASLGLIDGLPACYGDAEITIEGDLACSAEPDPWTTGPTWLEDGVCRFDDVDGPSPRVYGLASDLAAGRYRVSGHFDDPQARDCREPGGDDTDASRLRAILRCRSGFVATSAQPAE